MKSAEEHLQELVADLAMAIQSGATYPTAIGTVDPEFSSSPRFSCEVVDFNRVDVIDSDGKEYVVIIKEKD